MQQFLAQLSNAPRPFSRLGRRQRERLVENIHLDASSLRPSAWNYAPWIPPGRGDNLSPAALSEATQRLDSHAAVRGSRSCFRTLLNNAGAALNPVRMGGGCEFFFRTAIPAVPLSGRLWTVAPLRALQFSFSRYGAGAQKAAYDWLTSPAPAAPPTQPDGGLIGLCAMGSAFWLSDQSPFDFLSTAGLSPGTSAAAWAVLRELALPGYETGKRRETEMGLIATEFTADLLEVSGSREQAWKPTALDALNYKGYCFLPGGTADSHGLTLPLKANLRTHEVRDGLREYVHPRISVPALAGNARTVHLLGFFDAGAEAAWNSFSPP